MRELDFTDGFTSASEPDGGNIAANGLQCFADDSAFATAKGSAAAEGDLYCNETNNKPRYHNGTAFNNVTTDGTDETITGDWQFDALLEVATGSGNGLDTSSSGDLYIGETNADGIFIGRTGQTVTLPGNLTVQGTTTQVDTTNTNIKDTNITLNSGGNDASSEGSGITVERTGTDGSLIYEDALASKFKCGAAGSEIEILTASATQTITGKTINACDIDGQTASATARVTLSKDTNTNLTALGRKQATLYYDTTNNAVVFDDGSSLNTLITSGGVLTPVRFVFNGTIFIADNIDGYHLALSTKTLTSISLVVRDSGVSGTTSVVINRDGTSGTGTSATASVAASSGAVNSSRTSVSLALVLDDYIWPEVTAVAEGAEDLTIECIFS